MDHQITAIHNTSTTTCLYNNIISDLAIVFLVVSENPLALPRAKYLNNSLQHKQFHRIDVLWTQTLENILSGLGSSVDLWINTPLLQGLGVAEIIKKIFKLIHIKTSSEETSDRSAHVGKSNNDFLSSFRINIGNRIIDRWLCRYSNS